MQLVQTIHAQKPVLSSEQLPQPASTTTMTTAPTSTASTIPNTSTTSTPMASPPTMPLPGRTTSGGLRVAVVGCGHGELDQMYECVAACNRQASSGQAIDLLLCCGDFQSVRNYEDLVCMACPPKYRKLNTFYKYYTGEKKAPVLTIFIGGNHEASNYLVELFHGGWVAPNIYYLGFAGIVQFGGLRIGGLSGIFNDRHFKQGHYEHAPFDNDSQRSVYHVREYDVFQLMQYQTAATTATIAATSTTATPVPSSVTPLASPIDIFLSHDWPKNIAHHGNTSQLLRQKKFLADEVRDGSLGSPPAEQLLHALQPKFWFSAHLHVKFPAVVRHNQKDGSTSSSSSSSLDTALPVTQFLALDKCLPHREYMQILDFPHATGEKVLCYDPVWLAIVKNTHPYLSVQRHARPLPFNRPGQTQSNQRTNFAPTADELAWIHTHVPRSSTQPSLHPIPLNFMSTAPGWTESMGHDTRGQARQSPFVINPQTSAFLQMLQLPNVLTPAYSQQQNRSFQPQPFQPQQQSFSPSTSHVAKKQRMDEANISPLVHTNPDEINLDAVDEDASSTSAPMTDTHNPDEIALDDIDEDGHGHSHQSTITNETANTTAVATNPEEISLDEI